ncbi:helix-hairpin-helix domain-containing protein [Selenihalanaerobacter shriftii]|uniref:Competence protein ComEA n=1 Tax=Selenihalanaerobacter shriftii TaxID=142842 RepID=A0A1T4PPI8_9FIRM|nr:helix-hairpin-helix domain-containing protein [Selenihalanaerobacter shriftii]SJZ93515.1 competence protein ComEA [Selenihalanaerobacter shriftii]
MFKFTKKEEIILLVVIITLIIGSSLLIVKHVMNSDSEAKLTVNKENVQSNLNQLDNQDKQEQEEHKNNGDKILVQIGGAAKKPGVYKLREGSRIFQLLEKAEGPTSEADLDNINLAKEMIDGEKIIIPSESMEESKENHEEIKDRSSIQDNQSNKINLNTASKKELQKLYRVGPVLSEKIIQYRNQHGGFDKIDEIKKVSGIGDSTYLRNKDRLAI